MAQISEYLAADLSADASADALCIIKIGNYDYCPTQETEEGQQFLSGVL